MTRHLRLVESPVVSVRAIPDSKHDPRRTLPDDPRSGDVLKLTTSASPQFLSPIWFRVIRVHDWQTYDGWVWLDGYQLNAAGDAVERRSVFVLVEGLVHVQVR